MNRDADPNPVPSGRADPHLRAVLSNLSLSHYPSDGPWSNVDELIGNAVGVVHSLSEAERNQIASELERPDLGLLMRFGTRGAARALQIRSEATLSQAFLAKVLAWWEVPDARDAIVDLVPLHYVARKLGSGIFRSPIADLASPSLRLVLDTLGRRPEVSLDDFGWLLSSSKSGRWFKRP